MTLHFFISRNFSIYFQISLASSSVYYNISSHLALYILNIFQNIICYFVVILLYLISTSLGSAHFSENCIISCVRSKFFFFFKTVVFKLFLSIHILRNITIPFEDVIYRLFSISFYKCFISEEIKIS